MNHRKWLTPIFILLITTALGSPSENEPAVRFDSRVEWSEGVLIVTGETEVEPDYAGATARAERRILSKRETAFRRAVFDLPITSADTGAELAAKDEEITGILDDREALGSTTGVRPSRDLGSASVELRYPIAETIASVFQRHSIPRPVPSSASWVPTTDFTGLVIDARGTLPVHGEDRDAALKPVLLPRIYDSKMRLVLDAAMIEPEFLEQWGIAGYTTDATLTDLEERIGSNPLFVAADRAFGILPANPVIPHETAEQLITRDSNREMLAEGRVVIVLDADELR